MVLAGGTSSRLCPITQIANKHLFPVYNQPVLYYPLQRLVEASSGEFLVGGHVVDHCAALDTNRLCSTEDENQIIYDDPEIISDGQSHPR